MATTSPAGTITIAGDLVLGRLGYGAMQLPGPGVMGPPRDRDAALAVLREAIALGVRHIDTADYYGPAVSNELIREALHPYPDDLVIVTKVGAVRDDHGAWNEARDADSVRAQIDRNLEQLGVDSIDVVNMRLGGMNGPEDGPLPDGFQALIELQEQGVVRHLGVSEVTESQYLEARSMASVVCVQSNYNLAHREAESLVKRCEDDGIAFVPYFPLGGFSPLQSAILTDVAARIGVSAQQTALAWLLQHSPAIAVIPGTSSIAHLRENVAAADLTLAPSDVAALDAIAG